MELKGNPDRIEAFRRGDREVLAGLYRTHLEAVEKLLSRGFAFTSKGQTVRFRGYREPFRLREVTQEAFIHAFREKAREAYDETQPYRPYLITIARNLVIDRYRKEQTHAKYFVLAGDIAADDETEMEVVDRLTSEHDAQTSPELEAMQTQLAGTLKDFVAELEEEDRAVLERHLMGSLSQNAMADELGESRNDVRKRIREMRKRLLRHLKREGFIESLDAEEVLQTLMVLLAPDTRLIE